MGLAVIMDFRGRRKSMITARFMITAKSGWVRG